MKMSLCHFFITINFLKKITTLENIESDLKLYHTTQFETLTPNKLLLKKI